MKKVLVTSSLVAAMAAFSASASAQTPEVTASVSASNFYLWRGMNLGAPEPSQEDGDDTIDMFDGEAQIAADLNASMNGLYAGTWVSSGDSALGTEVDLYAGYGAELANGMSYDLSYWSYVYPSSDTAFGEAAEVIGSVGIGPLSAAVYYDVSTVDKSFYPDPDDSGGITYFTVGAEYGKFGVLFGKHDDDSYGEGFIHGDLTYTYNDNLSFTASFPIDKDEDNGKSELTNDPLLNATLTLPLEF